MDTWKWLLAATSLAAGGILLPRGVQSSAQDVRPIPTQTLAAEVRGTMSAKLTHSKDLLEGLVTRDFDKIEKAATAMKQVSLNGPTRVEGDQVEDELFGHFRLEFLRISTQLEEMAKKENLEGAAFAYQNLTAHCLACHSYLTHRDRRLIR
jgi:hypothetical protein